MNKADFYYKKNLKKIVSKGYLDEDPRPKYKDGTPAFTKYITQVCEKYDIDAGEFPLTTLRNTAIKTGIQEVLWIYQDQSNSLELAKKRGINWWDEWNIGDGTIGKRYGETIRKWDLMNTFLTNLKKDPFYRRHIINMYQESDLRESKGLYPCAYEIICSVRKKNDIMYLDLTLMQRSQDYIMAGYINKIQYVALQMMICSHLGYKPGKFCHFVQNLHIYDRHLDAAKELLDKEPLDIQPYIILKNNKKFYDFNIEDFEIVNNKNITKIQSSLEIAI
jgi:thymidylate synthase